MMMRAVLLVLALSVAAALHGAAADSLVIKNVTIVDPDAPAPEKVATVTIADGLIEAVDSSDSAAAREGTIIDGTDRFLIPGLWDCHAHASDLGIGSLRQFLAYGVTGIRDVGSDPVIVSWRERTAAGDLLGPRIITSGPLLRGGPGKSGGSSLFVETPEEAVAAVKTLKTLGVDFI